MTHLHGYIIYTVVSYKTSIDQLRRILINVQSAYICPQPRHRRLSVRDFVPSLIGGGMRVQWNQFCARLYGVIPILWHWHLTLLYFLTERHRCPCSVRHRPSPVGCFSHTQCISQRFCCCSFSAHQVLFSVKNGKNKGFDDDDVDEDDDGIKKQFHIRTDSDICI